MSRRKGRSKASMRAKRDQLAAAAALSPIPSRRAPKRKKVKEPKPTPPPKNDGERAARALEAVKQQRASNEEQSIRKERSRARVRRARDALKSIYLELQRVAKQVEEAYFKGGLVGEDLLGKPEEMEAVMNQGLAEVRRHVQGAKAEVLSLRFARLDPMPGEEGASD